VCKTGVTQKVLEEHGMNKNSIKSTLSSAARGGVKKCEMKSSRANPGRGALMGTEECLSQGRCAKKGWVKSVECVIGAPVEIDDLPSLAKKHGMGSIQCGMG